MKRYKVIALSVGGRRNKIHHLNDEVNEDQFPDGVADDLERKGFLKLIDENDEKPKFEPLPPQIISKEGKTYTAIDEITRKDLMKKLKERKIQFQANASKEELYELWIKE